METNKEQKKSIFITDSYAAQLANATKARILLCSDIHGDIQALKKITAHAKKHCDAFLFAGDGIADILYLLEKTPERFPPLTVLVAGNNDFHFYNFLGNTYFSSMRITIPTEQQLYIAGYFFLLTHGHLFRIHSSLTTLAKTAHARGIDIVIFGHTHIPTSKKINDVLLINPGSPTFPRSGSPKSFAILTLEKGEKPIINFFTLI